MARLPKRQRSLTLSGNPSAETTHWSALIGARRWELRGGNISPRRPLGALPQPELCRTRFRLFFPGEPVWSAGSRSGLRCRAAALGSSTMPDQDQGALYQLAYDEAKRAVVQQAAALDNLRSRAGTLLAVVSLSTSFLGGIVLQDKAPEGRLSWAAVGAFLGAVAVTLILLIPTRRWVFSVSAKVIVEQYAEGEHPRDVSTTHRYLALYLQDHFDSNGKRLKGLYWLFIAASVLLGGEVLLWLVVLITR
jgi:hypothetical protein